MPAPAAAQLDAEGSELEDDERERDERDQQHGNLEGARDVEDHVVDVVRAEREDRFDVGERDHWSPNCLRRGREGGGASEAGARRRG